MLKDDGSPLEGYPMSTMYPGHHDLLLGRGGETNNHSGNINFRRLIEAYRQEYQSASKAQKPEIAKRLVAHWRGLDPPGRFLAKEKNSELWVDIGDEAARRRASKSLGERGKQSNVAKPALPLPPGSEAPAAGAAASVAVAHAVPVAATTTAGTSMVGKRKRHEIDSTLQGPLRAGHHAPLIVAQGTSNEAKMEHTAGVGGAGAGLASTSSAQSTLIEQRIRQQEQQLRVSLHSAATSGMSSNTTSTIRDIPTATVGLAAANAATAATANIHNRANLNIQAQQPTHSSAVPLLPTFAAATYSGAGSSSHTSLDSSSVRPASSDTSGVLLGALSASLANRGGVIANTRQDAKEQATVVMPTQQQHPAISLQEQLAQSTAAAVAAAAYTQQHQQQPPSEDMSMMMLMMQGSSSSPSSQQNLLLSPHQQHDVSTRTPTAAELTHHVFSSTSDSSNGNGGGGASGRGDNAGNGNQSSKKEESPP